MKAERRHELKTNTLARSLEELPNYGRQYGSRILLGITLVLLVFVAVRYWRTSVERRENQVKQDLDTARTSLRNLSNLPFGSAPAPEIARERQQAIDDAEKSINDVLAESRDTKMMAQAYLARGDLNWRLANLPEVPGAETQPSLKLPKSDKDYLEAARSAYEKVLEPPINEQHEAVVWARLGLAAVAENRSDWAEARRQYQAIVDDPNAGQASKDEAKDRTALLPELEKPLLLGTYTPPTTQPSEKPVLGPVRPTTQPGGSTGPTTAPSATRPG